MIDIIPGIFEKEWDELERKVRLAAPYADWIQIDIADGSLVPAQTALDFEKFKALIFSLDHHGNEKSLHFEAHLMVASPEKYVRKLVQAGFERIIAHVEANDPRLFLDEAKMESVEVGLALDGASEAEVIEPFLESVDLVVIMTIEAGSPDAPFLPESLEKIRAIRHRFPDLPIAAEGNIDERNGKLLTDVGVTRLVVSADTSPETALISPPPWKNFRRTSGEITPIQKKNCI